MVVFCPRCGKLREARGRRPQQVEIMSNGGARGMHQELKLLIVGLILVTFSILLAGAARDSIDSFIQLTVPVTEKALSGGYLFLWRIFYFLLILSLLTIASICLV